jgi:site-specific recombinase XerD
MVATLPSTARPAHAPDAIANLATDFYVSLRAANKAARTVETYREAIEQFDAFLATKGMPRTAGAIRREHVESFLDYLLNERVDERTGRKLKPATARNRYASLQQFFAWAVDEDEIDTSPMAKMKAPQVAVEPVPLLTDAEQMALLKSCAGPSFDQRRDLAMIRLLLDSGLRRAELCGLTLDDVDVAQQVALVRNGKGGKFRVAPFGAEAAQALSRYLRARRNHRLAGLTDRLWLGKGATPITPGGVAQIIRRRGLSARPPIDRAKLHPHALRHTWSHVQRVSGVGDADLMQLAGWSSPDMLRRYGASAAQERAILAYRQARKGRWQ